MLIYLISNINCKSIYHFATLVHLFEKNKGTALLYWYACSKTPCLLHSTKIQSGPFMCYFGGKCSVFMLTFRSMQFWYILYEICTSIPNDFKSEYRIAFFIYWTMKIMQ
jgi:hypothetical protein